MTPLAQRWVAEMAKPLSQRKLIDNGNVSKRIMGATFFDCSEVYQAAVEMALGKQMDNPSALLAFLPAPVTWIEVRDDFGDAALLIENGRNDEASITSIVLPNIDNASIQSAHSGSILLGSSARITMDCIPCSLDLARKVLEENSVDISQRKLIEAQAIESERANKAVYALLAMINSPRVIGRRQKAIGFTAARKLLKAQKTVGKFPLRAWTEIVLEVTPPKVVEDAVQEATLTGRRALHFVRQHLRIWNGRLILVSAHWRGDGALGIKQTRYRLTKPKGRAA